MEDKWNLTQWMFAGKGKDKHGHQRGEMYDWWLKERVRRSALKDEAAEAEREMAAERAAAVQGKLEETARMDKLVAAKRVEQEAAKVAPPIEGAQVTPAAEMVTEGESLHNTFLSDTVSQLAHVEGDEGEVPDTQGDEHAAETDTQDSELSTDDEDTQDSELSTDSDTQDSEQPTDTDVRGAPPQTEKSTVERSAGGAEGDAEPEDEEDTTAPQDAGGDGVDEVEQDAGAPAQPEKDTHGVEEVTAAEDDSGYGSGGDSGYGSGDEMEGDGTEDEWPADEDMPPCDPIPTVVSCCCCHKGVSPISIYVTRM